MAELDDPIVRLAFFPPGQVEIAVGGAVAVDVIAIRASGAQQVVTFDANLELTTDGSAFSSNVGPQGILISGLRPGSGLLSASLDGARAFLVVVVEGDVSLVGLEIDGPRRLLIGRQGPLAVTALFSDGSRRDVTTDPATRIFVNTGNAVEIVGTNARGAALGTSAIIAEYFTQSATIAIDVVADPGAISRLEFVPSSVVLPEGDEFGGIRVRATSVNGAVFDVTFSNEIAYVPSGGIDFSLQADGLTVVGVAAGNGALTATFRGATARLDIRVIPVDAELVRIVLSAPSALQRGTVGSYAVTAQFSDGRTEDVTDNVATTVEVQPPNVLFAAFGRLEATAVGTATLRAEFGGESDSATIVVVDEVDPVRLIAFLPPQLSLQVGGQADVELIGVRLSGDVVDLTNSLEVSIRTEGPVAVLDPRFTVFGEAEGLAQVTATFRGLQASLPVSVGNAPTLVDLFVDPAGPIDVPLGSTVPLAVTGVFSDGSVRLIDGASFFSPAEDIASVTATGVVTGVGIGTTPILVTFGGFVRLIGVNVIASAPTITAVDPAAIPVGTAASPLQVFGANFDPTAVVVVGGRSLAPASVTASRLGPSRSPAPCWRPRANSPSKSGSTPARRTSHSSKWERPRASSPSLRVRSSSGARSPRISRAPGSTISCSAAAICGSPCSTLRPTVRRPRSVSKPRSVWKPARGPLRFAMPLAPIRSDSK